VEARPEAEKALGTAAPCPATFSFAIGEREDGAPPPRQPGPGQPGPGHPQGHPQGQPHPMPHGHGMAQTANPLAELGGSMRTQLWKPSRSWWEAKSGKNPWIEPASHNRRWRYLWPLVSCLVWCVVVWFWFGLVWCGVAWCGVVYRFGSVLSVLFY
jgi:hypothetical protein